MARIEAAGAVGNVWAKTLASYKKDLSRKDLLVVEEITFPTDIANHIEDLEARTHVGKSGAFADRIHAITGRLTRFSSVIDAVTSSNAEASLIWGSLKLLLTIVHQSSEEYDKICRSILAVSESFPIVDMITETFNHSELVCGPVADFYACVLRFWSKALRFYKRRRIFNIFRAWHDFDSEFGDLDRDMKRFGKIVEKAAATVHMHESRTARLEQKAIGHELLEANRSTITSNQHRDIIQWLAPLNHEAGYFVDDLRSASESRHPDTCTWILHRPEFGAWINSGPNDAVTRMLWLTGVPGAGKTVLSSFVINTCFKVSGKKPSPPVLYFFFKMTDSDKDSVLAVTRSLVYQLYSLMPASLCADIVSLRDESGKEKALSDQRLWDLFVKHATELEDLTIILDALDECDDVDLLLRRMIPFLERCNARALVVSRREENITLALEYCPHIFIGQDDVEADICSYVTAEIGKIPRFQGKPVQQRMISALSSGHGGMFLWAYLMVKELKELGTIRQVNDALKALPTGLEEMHKAIVTRLDSTLHKAHRELATKILTWVVCAVRPLRLVELQEILRFEIRQGRRADHLQDDDDDLLYSEKDIEMACGALVVSRNGTLQLIHLSTKEILMRRPPYMHSDDSRLAFYVDSQRENPHMARLCVSYISTHLNGVDSVTRPNLETVSRLRLGQESFDSTVLVTKSPFIDYASISWLAHLIDGKISLELEGIMRCLQTLLTYDWTLLWIESCVLLHQDIIWELQRGCTRIMSWADYTLVPAQSSCRKAIEFLRAWSSAVVSIINEYGYVIEKYPYEIHYLDLENVLSSEDALGPVAPALFSASMQGWTVREQISVIRAVDKPQPKIEVEPCRQLQSNLPDPSRIYHLEFVLYDNSRDVYFLAESQSTNATEMLRVQERASGRRLQSIKSTVSVFNAFCEVSESSLPQLTYNYLRVEAAILSPDRMYLAILYVDPWARFVTSIWKIERHLDFLNIRDRRPWARQLHCLGSQNDSFLHSCLPLTVGQDGFFYCPSGRIHPESGIHERIPDSVINTTDDERWEHETSVELAFAGNGQTIIRLDRSVGRLKKVFWLENTVAHSLHSAFMPGDHEQWYRPCLRAISQTARFVVYGTLQKDPGTPLYHFLDTMLDSRRCLKELPVDQLTFLKARFLFSKDERYLFCLSPTELNSTRFSRWAISEPGSISREETKFFVPNKGMGTVCLAEDDSMIILVDRDRLIYEIDLERLEFKAGSLTSSMGSNLQHQLYSQRHYRVSSNGLGVVGLYIKCPASSNTTTCDHEKEPPMSPALRKTRLELKFVDLSGTADQMRTIELEYLDSYPSMSHKQGFTFSPDLSLLQVGPHIFDLLAPGHPQLYFPESPLGNLQGGPLVPRSRISFSSCNGYLKIIQGEDPVAKGGKATLGLYRICRTGGRIERIVIADLEGLVADSIRATFHPMLPLLMLTCITYGGHDLEDTVTDARVMEVDLEALESFRVALPVFDIVKLEENFESVEARFSDCGSSCFLDGVYDGNEILSSVFLEKRQAKMQIPALWDEGTSYNGRFYRLKYGIAPQTLALYQAIDHPRKNGLRDGPEVDREPECRIAVNVTVFPSHLMFEKKYLLAGENGDDLVRIVFLPDKGPPEIKHLRVTLNQILAELEEIARDVEPNIKKLFQREYGDSEEDFEEDSEEESSGLGSGRAAMSADEDGSEGLETS